MDSLEPGTLLARRYRLIDRIGVGGMSVIWRAHDEMLERGVAVKVLAADLAADPRFRQRVRDEARAAAALVHPRITATYDYGEVFDADGAATAYVVMELLGGEPLSARLTAGPLPWPEALRTGAEVAEALAAAHRHGIVHRDITSDNIMLTGDGAKVLDFGIATTIGAPDEDIDGSTFGTPAYVAPERLDGQRARPATDTYALGVLLYEMLTGSPPYPADTWDELAATARDVPPALEVPGLPQPVSALCHRCLAVEPRQRPTANQVAWTLRKHLPGAGRSRRAVALRRALVGAGVAAALALGVVVGATLLSSQPPATPPTADDPPTSPLPSPAPAPASTPPPDDGPAATSGPPPPPGGGGPPPSTVTPNRPPSVPGQVPAPDPETPDDEPVSLDPVGEIVESAEAGGDLRGDIADDLTNMISNLEIQLDHGTIDMPGATAQLRHLVETRNEEGTLDDAVADDLHAALNQLVT